MYNFSVTRADAEGLFWARGVELDLAVRIEQSPVSLVLHLPIVTLTHRLPRLVKGLKVEDIHTPVQHAADTLLPVSLSVAGASLGITVVLGTIYYASQYCQSVLELMMVVMSHTSRPASLAVGKADVLSVVTSDLLDVVQGRRHVVKVGVVGLVDGVTLPVCETVGETRMIHTSAHRSDQEYVVVWTV